MRKLLILIALFAAHATAQITRDPTEPQISYNLQQKDSSLVLSAILSNGPQRRAVINNTILKESDSINNYTILEIHKDYVLILNNTNGQERKIYIFAQDVIHEPSTTVQKHAQDQ
jgi:hypothetical protein